LQLTNTLTPCGNQAYPAPPLNNEKIVKIFLVFAIAKNPEMSYNTLGRLLQKITQEMRFLWNRKLAVRIL
jgi:hypothetical protein